MVFFRSQAAILKGEGSGENAPAPASETLLEDVNGIPDDLLSEQGQAYLRLLSQLAACGLDAAGPPLLPSQSCG